MAGVYCERCECSVMVEQDGKSCSNCGIILVGKNAGKAPGKAKKPNRPDETLPAPRDVIDAQDEAALASESTADEKRESAAEAADFQRTQQPKKKATKE